MKREQHRPDFELGSKIHIFYDDNRYAKILLSSSCSNFFFFFFLYYFFTRIISLKYDGDWVTMAAVDLESNISIFLIQFQVPSISLTKMKFSNTWFPVQWSNHLAKCRHIENQVVMSFFKDKKRWFWSV